jgi:hypothetical protein
MILGLASGPGISFTPRACSLIATSNHGDWLALAGDTPDRAPPDPAVDDGVDREELLESKYPIDLPADAGGGGTELVVIAWPSPIGANST